MAIVKDKKSSGKSFECFEKFQHGLFSWRKLNQNGNSKSFFEIANMDFLACKICHKMPVFGLGPTLAALNLTYTVHGKA